jgi:hypothetical protein
MAKQTLAQRQAAEDKARRTFLRRAQLVQSWDETWRFAAGGPRSGSPGGKYYTNLCHYMNHGHLPVTASGEELAVVRALEARLGPLPRQKGA